MPTSLENPKFDIEQFRTKLTKLRENFGHNSYITYSSNTDLAEVREKEEAAKQDYEKILDLCVEALLQTDDKDAIVNLINREFIGYYYPNEISLFDPAEKIDFWRNIALKLAKKASAPAEAANAKSQATAAQTAAITAEVGAAAQEAVQETGRNFLEALKASGKDGSYEKSKFMQVGDYIKIPRAYAASRFGFKMEDGKNGEDIVKVRITKITGENITRQIEVELDGQTREVDGSLFYNFGKSFIH